MSVLVILIFTMTFRIFAREYATLNDSVSLNFDSKRPHMVLQFNFSKDTYSQHRFPKYGVERRSEIPNGTKVIKPTFVVRSKQFPVAQTQTLRKDETKKNWRRKRFRKHMKTFSRHVSNDLILLGVNATELKGVKLGQTFDEFSEEGPQAPQSRRKFKDRMKELIFKERILNPMESNLNSSKTIRPIKPRIAQKLINRTISRQYLPQYEAFLRKSLRNKLAFGRLLGLKMLQPVAQEVHFLAAKLLAKCKTPRSHKSFRYYNKCHDRLRAILNRISEHETLKQNNTITLVRLLSRSKRHTKSRSVKAPRKADDAKGKSTADKSLSTEKAKPAKPKDVKKLKEIGTKVDPFEEQIDFVQHLKNFVLNDLKNVKGEDQPKKTKTETEKQLDEKRKESKSDIAKAEEVKTTSSTVVHRDLNGTDVDDPEPNRFSAVELVPPEQRDIIFLFRRTTTKKPCQKDDTLFALVMGFGICFGLLLFGICIAVCLIDDEPQWNEREPLIIYTRRPTEDTVIVDESGRHIDRLPRRRWSYDDIRGGGQHSRRERRRRRRLARRPRYIQLRASDTWPLNQQTGLNLQPAHMSVSERPGRIQLPTATPVAQLRVDTKRPESPEPRSEGRSKTQLPASTSAKSAKENTMPPKSSTSIPKSPSNIQLPASKSGTPLNEITGPPMSQALKTERPSKIQVAVPSTSASPLNENTGPPMSLAPKTEIPSKIQVSTSAIPLYENTGPPRS